MSQSYSADLVSYGVGGCEAAGQILCIHEDSRGA